MTNSEIHLVIRNLNSIDLKLQFEIKLIVITISFLPQNAKKAAGIIVSILLYAFSDGANDCVSSICRKRQLVYSLLCSVISIHRCLCVCSCQCWSACSFSAMQKHPLSCEHTLCVCRS